MDIQSLHQILENLKSYTLGKEFFISKVPDLITNNLKQNISDRDYQKEAIGRFIYHFEKNNTVFPLHLLFHMATGSGKTLIMAGLILYLYSKGYRNFLFFVNSTNIIDKTKNNFLNPYSVKFLFSEPITISDKKISVKEVTNFQNTNNNDINIVFSTIQGLHSRLNNPRENSITYDDFENNKIVLISDEAHHINAETRRNEDLTKEERNELFSWERTVRKIFEQNSSNILLEFTATMDLFNDAIKQKYFDKLIFDYPLKQFRNDGYSKEVNVLEAEMKDIDRSLQAVLLSQYRRKIFEKHKILIKPVLLFKSKTIAESNEFYEKFLKAIKNLKGEQIEKIFKNSNNPLIKTLGSFFKTNSFENLVIELQEDFSDSKCLIINSKEESEQNQIAVNTLEDKNNEFRVIFAVDKLNEGWDVLNLFDIVRLYDTRDARANIPGKTTMSEAQLIGRGARYCPFQLSEDQPLYKRKFDNDLNNEMRICEELYYHSSYNPKYIQELNTALDTIGIKPKAVNRIQLRLKESFIQSEVYKKGLLFLNKKYPYKYEDVKSLSDLIGDENYRVDLRSEMSLTGRMLQPANITDFEINEEKITITYELNKFGIHIIRKALNQLEFYNFNTLNHYLPEIKSILDFINSSKGINKIKVDVTSVKNILENLTQEAKLYIVRSVLKQISERISKNKIEFKGTNIFYANEINKIFEKKEKILNFDAGNTEVGIAQSQTNNDALRLNIPEREWYAFNDNYGTSEEKYLTKYINKVHDELTRKFKQIYLIRNEGYFQIYNFEDGRAFEPDFVLYLLDKNNEIAKYYQVFIEPKGERDFINDEWKEKFLLSLKEKAKIEYLVKSKKFNILGMPFYNEALTKNNFEETLSKELF